MAGYCGEIRRCTCTQSKMCGHSVLGSNSGGANGGGASSGGANSGGANSGGASTEGGKKRISYPLPQNGDV